MPTGRYSSDAKSDRSLWLHLVVIKFHNAVKSGSSFVDK